MVIKIVIETNGLTVGYSRAFSKPSASCSAVRTNINSIVPFLLNVSRATSLRVSLCLVCDDDLLDDP